MTDKTPPTAMSTERRIDRIESGLEHFQKITDLQHGQIREAVHSIGETLRKQGEDLELTEERMMNEIKAIYGLLWKSIGWLGSTLAVTLLMLILKAVKLY